MTHVWLAVAVASAAAAVALLLGDRLRRRRHQAQAVLKGVRSVISGDPDAAIEALSSAARLGSPEAVETYLALGALFRREGDLARAVRLHRNMLMGPGLPPARRPEVERELAEDYRRSGMLAEAAEIYGRHASADLAAAVGLRDVRVEQGDLAAAAEIQRRMPGGGPDPILAHLLAARAREVLPADVPTARSLSRQALEAARGSADAWLALAEAEAAAGSTGPALEAVGEALRTDRRTALQAWPALGQVPDGEEAVRFLGLLLAERPEEAALHVLHARALARVGRRPQAFEAVRRALERDESGEVTFALRELLRGEQAARPGELSVPYDLLVAALLRRGRAPRCGRCGADAPARSWRCRRCGAWDSY